MYIGEFKSYDSRGRLLSDAGAEMPTSRQLLQSVKSFTDIEQKRGAVRITVDIALPVVRPLSLDGAVFDSEPVTLEQLKEGKV